MSKLLDKVKKYKKISGITGVLIVLLGGYLIYTKTTQESAQQEQTEDMETVNTLDLTEKKQQSTFVKTNGEVEAKQKINLKSEVSAKVRNIYPELGNKVYAGQTLVVFENSSQASQVQQARASLRSAQAQKEQLQSALDSQKAQLRKLKSGPRLEQVEQARTRIDNAEKSLKNAEENLEQTKQSNQSSINNTLMSALNTANVALNQTKSIILDVTELQYDHFTDNSQDSLRLAEAKREAIEKLFDQEDAGRWIKRFISTLDGGLYQDIDNELQSPQQSSTLTVINDTIVGLESVKSLLNTVPIIDDFTSADETKLNNAKTTINQQLQSVRAQKEAINVQDSTNQSKLQQANSQVAEAENALDSAKDNLAIVMSGAQQEDIEAQEKAVEQAEANLRLQEANIESARASLLSAQSAYSKTVIRSPINGTVSAIEVDRGELLSPSSLVARVVNTDGYQIKTYLSSEAVQNLEVGNTTTIAGDIDGQVANISPSLDPEQNKVQTIISVTEEDPNLVAGDFVDVKIKKSLQQKDTILLPIESVSLTNEGSFVYVVNESGEIERREMEIGNIVASQIEVKSGLKDIDEIVASTRGLEVGDKVQTN